ncbi:MAG: MarR family transcriptional regulator [Clostridiales bacterium]|nr:MarR family transcriptional regulator [Candidatus Cacconaster stercorequi]
MKICQQVPEHFGPLMGYCHHQVQMLLDRRLRQYDLTPMQCRTLTYLNRASHEVNQKMLEEHLMVKPSTVNGIVDRLEEKGMLQRQSSKSDGRCRILHLTPQGRTCQQELSAIVEQVNQQMEQDFTPEELDTLKNYLVRVAHNLSRQNKEEPL